ncbi:hypothetical protein DFH07DRAFT_958649 [Mycena maculata]|uniref:Uncharacterized protein n=1 Tax=Mycena maculata TaxID=230809 RepID=A0AAD7J8E2_9AGAR|nr:hypothetical protein DFH07DRAFT_958649 [Mycena maculata]
MAIIIWSRVRPTLAELPLAPSLAINAVVAARILLNIKNLTSEVKAFPATEISAPSWDRPARAVNVRIPWYLRTGEKGFSEDF